jgi:hypothetical protein
MITAPNVISVIEMTGPISLISEEGLHEQRPLQEQLNQLPFQIYGIHAPPLQPMPKKFNEPSEHGSEPQGRTMTSHSLNLRPVAAHRKVEAHKVATA